jgi:hypothetical protein
MARIRDRDRYKNNSKRREFVYESSKRRNKIRNEENRNWDLSHGRADFKIKQL